MKNRYFVMFLGLSLGAFFSLQGFGQDNSSELLKKLEEMDKAAQRNLDMLEIENLMGLHALQNKGNLKASDPAFRETVAQKAQGVCYGVDDKYLYENAARKAMHGWDDPTFGKAGTLKMHMTTTGYIQIAEDGKTAKGVWYSPGYQTEMGTDGKPKAAWDFKRYGVDFVKEEGKWKIWHFVAFTDFVTPPNVSWTEKVTIPNTTIQYQTWSPETGAQNKLRAPSAYKTFSETTSYCPAEGSKK